jgi:hypothetical protein
MTKERNFYSWENVSRYIKNEKIFDRYFFKDMLDNTITPDSANNENDFFYLDAFLHADPRYVEIFLEKYPELLDKTAGYFAFHAKEDIVILLISKGCDLNNLAIAIITSLKIMERNLFFYGIPYSEGDAEYDYYLKSRLLSLLLNEDIDIETIAKEILIHLDEVVQQTDNEVISGYFESDSFKEMINSLKVIGIDNRILISFLDHVIDILEDPKLQLMVFDITEEIHKEEIDIDSPSPTITRSTSPDSLNYYISSNSSSSASEEENQLDEERSILGILLDIFDNCYI